MKDILVKVDLKTKTYTILIASAVDMLDDDDWLDLLRAASLVEKALEGIGYRHQSTVSGPETDKDEHRGWYYLDAIG